MLLADWKCLSSVLFSSSPLPTPTMAEVDVPDELLDYEEEVQEPQDGAGDAAPKKDVKGTYVSIHSSGFRDFLLKPELLRAIVDCGFEHPSEGENMNPIADLQ